VKHEIGCEGRRMSRFHHWRYLIHMFSDAEPLLFLTRLYGFLAGDSGDLLEGRHLRGHTSSKSVYRAAMYAEVNMHGGLQWFADGDQKELYPVRLSREIWLIHFDIFNPDQLASKTAHIQEVLSRGDTRSPGRAATLRGLDALVNSGSMTLDEFFRRYISMKPRAWRVARLLRKVRTFDLSEAFHSMPPVPENEDVKYGENQGNA
jgi:hypothetical protein